MPERSVVPEPEDLSGKSGVLEVTLTYRNFTDAAGLTRYCYLDQNGKQAPTLRLQPGDELILHLKNALDMASDPAPAAGVSMVMSPAAPCASKGAMTAGSTNLHFHGLTILPQCHQDDVLRTIVNPGDPPFEYRFRIPSKQPPGLYWYHPHVHGLTNAQVIGGASGALVVEGIERASRSVAGLPERVFIVRDQALVHPDAAPAGGGSQLVLLDSEGDVRNTGNGGGKPARDLSVNYVPVPYPDYPPAVIEMRPSEKQLWRVLNASAVTYLNLQVILKGMSQTVGVVAVDGIPIPESSYTINGVFLPRHLLVPPAGRVEFIVKGPPAGEQMELITDAVNTGPDGENDPLRPLAVIVGSEQAPEPRSVLSSSATTPLAQKGFPELAKVSPVRERKLYFSEGPLNPADPASPTAFFITVDGQKPAIFDPSSSVPNITARQGDVEDWVIENRSQEVHAFHIHQIHFLLVAANGVSAVEPFLRDTIDVPFWDGKSSVYPSVKLRMDFRDPNTVGTFVYHCHLLDHEDGGMMGTIRIDPAPAKKPQKLLDSASKAHRP